MVCCCVVSYRCVVSCDDNSCGCVVWYREGCCCGGSCSCVVGCGDGVLMCGCVVCRRNGV